VLGDERSGSGPDLFRVGRFIPGGGPSSVARSARGAGADARAQLYPLRRCFAVTDYDTLLTLSLVTNYGFGRIVTRFMNLR